MKKLLLLLMPILIVLATGATPTLALAPVSSNTCNSIVGKGELPNNQQPGCTAATGGGGGPVTACAVAPQVNFTTVEQYRQAILTKFGLDLSLTLDQMQYAWEEFHEIGCVGILQDIKGASMRSWGYNYSQQFACPQDKSQPSVMVGAHHGGDWVKALLLHELTHVWQWCSTRGEASRLEIPSIMSREGGITNYSRTGCGFGVSLVNEDHADSIALFLNPTVGELTCGGGAPNPYTGGRFRLHYNMADTYVGK
ncbi:MAG: hypothetical protein KBC15_02035 [Candidatus Levybacteria bacterium]|nr:hypothetical protein [Candidatus Levybacteria bacterium]